MPDEVPADAPIPEPMPEPAPITASESIPEPIPPQVETSASVEPPTAQIPANEPIVPAPEVEPPTQPTPTPPEPVPVPEPSVPVSVVAPVIHFARDLLVKARGVIQSRKRKKLDKILEAIIKHGSITNDQVEKLLRVSDATATRYLMQLEKEGKLKQEGKTGKSVKYLKL